LGINKKKIGRGKNFVTWKCTRVPQKIRFSIFFFGFVFSPFIWNRNAKKSERKGWQIKKASKA